MVGTEKWGLVVIVRLVECDTTIDDFDDAAAAGATAAAAADNGGMLTLDRIDASILSLSTLSFDRT